VNNISSVTRSGIPGPAARLRWQGGDLLPPDVRTSLLGRGAPFELVTEDVLGRPRTVFATRPPNLRSLLDEAVERAPEGTFLVDGERSWTFARAREEIDAIARALVDGHGIRPGDRVAIAAANSPEYALVMWAVLSAGAVVVSLNGWWTGVELRYGIELAGPSLLTGDGPRLERLSALDPVPEVPVVPLGDLVAQGRARGDSAPLPVEVDEDDPAVILFTSGTTGRPKGATLSHRNIVHFAQSTQLSAAIGAALAPPAPTGSSPATIASSPMFHISGMVGVLATGPGLGSTLVFPPPGRWDAGQHIELTARHRVTSWSGVPTQFWRILRHADRPHDDLRSVRSLGSGGAPFPPDLVRALQDAMPWVMLANGYGMSETTGLGTLNAGPAMLGALDSVGPAQVGMEVEVRDPLGAPLGDGEIGEIHLRGPAVFLGYWDNPGATAAALDDDGWYRTGDFGRIAEGRLYLESRMRDLILRGGENVYPIEVENRLVEHPDVEDAAVIGVDHRELGQEVKAFVVARPGSRLGANDVQRWTAETLARYKVPAHVEFRDSLPYTDTGKVLKHQLEREERQRAESAVTTRP
jgi:acyl-CoA synthetase (AMP-forming)/AMP-acid ligase II